MKPRYYCENCGGEVKSGAASCPHCGSRFTSVRCPQCGYEGRESGFRAGCPACGYMVAPQPGAPTVSAETPKRDGKFLPGWFYRVAAIALLVAVVVLLVVLLAHT